MSVEINVGDSVRLYKINCFVLHFKSIDAPLFTTKETYIDKPISGEVIFYKKDIGLEYVIVDTGTSLFFVPTTFILDTNHFYIGNTPTEIQEPYPNKWAEWVKSCKGTCSSPTIKYLYSKIFFPKDKFNLLEKIKAIVVYRGGLSISYLLVLFKFKYLASNLKGKIYRYLNCKIHPYLKNV